MFRETSAFNTELYFILIKKSKPLDKSYSTNKLAQDNQLTSLDLSI